MDKNEIKYKIVGRTIVAPINKKKFSTTYKTVEEKEKILAAITSYNKRNTDEKLKKVMNFFAKEEIAKKTKAKIDKKVSKNKVKKLTTQLKALKNTNGDVLDPATLELGGSILSDKRFVAKDGNIYLNPYVQVPMPKKLIEKLVSCITNKVPLEPYINFWMLALLNPNEVARTKLFDYLDKHNLIVTPNGYFVTFRMVKTTDRKTADGKPIFTSAHKKVEDYVMGEAYRIPRVDCDEDGTRDCSKGLHTGSPLFIGIQPGDGYGVKEVTTKTANPGSYGTGYDRPTTTTETKRFDQTFGNQAVICLVNPMHVVSIPLSDTRKMRSCELFFVKLTTAEEVIDLTEKDYLLYDVDYKEYEAQQLKEMLKTTKLKHWADTKDLDKITAAKKAELEKIKAGLNIGTDKINTNNLTLSDINKIIQSRIK